MAPLMSNGHSMMPPAAAGNGHRSRSSIMPPAVTLSSGHRMPAVGLGVWRMDKADVRGLIHAAIRQGYRHFDCAGMQCPAAVSSEVYVLLAY